MKLDDFNYDLPNKFIAQEFAEPRDNSKLMVIEKDKIIHKKFYDIIDFLKKGDVLVINETKVAPNKILGKKPTGAGTQFIIENKIGNAYQCRIKGSHPKLGNDFEFPHGLKAKIVKANADIFHVEFNKEIEPYLQKYGKLPLPSYVQKEIKDEQRYQTSYAKKGKSLAAPTAGLHFTKKLIKDIEDMGVIIAKVRLDISFNTFLSITEKNIKTNKLHEEFIAIEKDSADVINNRKGRLVVCGTTSLRTLESFSNNGTVQSGKKITDIFIKPGYKSQINPDIIITNFHLPKSSLLMMISAYIEKKNILKAYEEAKNNNYRFFSLGDAMLIIV